MALRADLSAQGQAEVAGPKGWLREAASAGEALRLWEGEMSAQAATGRFQESGDLEPQGVGAAWGLGLRRPTSLPSLQSGGSH